MKAFGEIFRGAVLVCIVYLVISLVVSPQVCINAGKMAIDVCLGTVIPSLFPFFICSGLFSSLGFAKMCSKNLSPLMRSVFNISGSGALAFVLGIVSGYPIGAVCASDLYRSGECTKTEAERMVAFCNNSGPLFVIGVVGCGFLKSREAGYYLYIAHIISAILTGIIFRFYKGTKNESTLELPQGEKRDKKNTAGIIGSVFENAIWSILKICGFVVFFSVFAAVLPDGKLKPFIHSLFEITGGIRAVSVLDIEPTLRLVIISFVLALSGISVMFQVSSVIAPSSISIVPYIFGKLTHACLSAVITYFMLTKIPITQNVFAENYAFILKSVSPVTVMMASFMCSFLGVAITLAASFVFGRIKRYR